jgi:hypothetical protein
MTGQHDKPNSSPRLTPICGESKFEEENARDSASEISRSHTLTTALEQIVSLIAQRDLLTQLLGDALRESERLRRELHILRHGFPRLDENDGDSDAEDETDILDRR